MADTESRRAGSAASAAATSGLRPPPSLAQRLKLLATWLAVKGVGAVLAAGMGCTVLAQALTKG